MRNKERNDFKELVAKLESNIRARRKERISKKLLKYLDAPRRKRVSVNIYKIDKLTKEGDSVIVPGKVLSEGKISHKINIAAVEYSSSAKRVLEEANATTKSIEELMNSKNVKIIV